MKKVFKIIAGRSENGKIKTRYNIYIFKGKRLWGVEFGIWSILSEKDFAGLGMSDNDNDLPTDFFSLAEAERWLRVRGCTGKDGLFFLRGTVK